MPTGWHAVTATRRGSRNNFFIKTGESLLENYSINFEFDEIFGCEPSGMKNLTLADRE
jgi:hypothetical protein